MFDPAAPGQAKVAGAAQHSPESGTRGAPGGRGEEREVAPRVTAASFRALTERLKAPPPVAALARVPRPERPAPAAPAGAELVQFVEPFQTDGREIRETLATPPAAAPAADPVEPPRRHFDPGVDAAAEAGAALEPVAFSPSDEPHLAETSAAVEAGSEPGPEPPPAPEPAVEAATLPEHAAEAEKGPSPLEDAAAPEAPLAQAPPAEPVSVPEFSAARPPPQPDARSAEMARTLLDIMSMPAGSQPQERALAADMLLKLIDRMPHDALMRLSERISIMEAPPPLILKRLILHPDADVAAPLLESCNAITDRDLIDIVEQAEPPRLKLIARRRHISPALADAIIRRDEPNSNLALLRNHNASLSQEAFRELAARAKIHHNLQAPLATRPDTPPPIAFDLFWTLPGELRRYVLSRFLTESTTLERILKLARSVDAITESAAQKPLEARHVDELVALITEGSLPEAARLMAEAAGISEACANRIICDPDGEPLVVVMKALGVARAHIAEATARWQSSPAAPIPPERDITDLQALFETLSFNKARMLLTYWDWAARRAGPYAQEAA